MNEEEDIRGGATDEQINQAYKEAKINEQRDPRTDEKFLEERAKKNKIKGFDSSESMLDEEFEAQKELQEDDLTAEQEFRDVNRGIDFMYELGKIGAESLYPDLVSCLTLLKVNQKVKMLSFLYSYY